MDGAIDLTSPQAILDWSRATEPEGMESSRAKLQADRFVAQELARHVRISYAVIDVVMQEPDDAIDDLQ